MAIATYYLSVFEFDSQLGQMLFVQCLGIDSIYNQLAINKYIYLQSSNDFGYKNSRLLCLQVIILVLFVQFRQSVSTWMGDR